MADLTRSALAQQLAERAELTKVAAADEVKWLVETIAAAIAKGDTVHLHGLGTFRTSATASRTRTPRIGEPVKVAARRAVQFTAARALDSSLNAKPAR